MAGKTAVLAVKIISDARGAVSGMGQAQQQAGLMGKAMTAAGVGIAAAGAAAVGYGVKAVKAAGDLEQSAGAVDSVFKGGAAQMHSFSDAAATSVGLSKNEYNELATLIGAQLKNAGTSMDQLGGKTNDMIGLGADMASMFGGTTTEAVEALSSALKGEMDPIERYGVSLNQSTLDAKAAEMGIKKVGGAFTTQQKAAVTMAAIMDQTKDAQGNFGRESDTLAHKQQVLAAQLENVKTTVGMALLPIVSALASFILTTAVPAFQSFGAGVAAAVGKVQAGLSGLAGFYTEHQTAVTAFATVIGVVLLPAIIRLGVAATVSAAQQVAAWAVSAAGSVGAVASYVVASAAIVAGWVLMGVQSLIQAARMAAAWVIALGPIAWVTAAIIGIAVLVIANWDKIVAWTTFAWNMIVTQTVTKWNNMVNTVVAVVGAVVGGVTGAWTMVVNRTVTAWNTVVSGTVNTWNTVVGAIVSAVRGFATAVSNGVGAVVGFFRDLPGRIWGTLQSLVNDLYTVGGNMIIGMANGIYSKAQDVVNGVLSVARNGIRAVKNFLGIHSPSRVMRDQVGANMGLGIAEGLKATAGTVTRAAQSVVSGATAPLDAFSAKPVELNVYGTARSTAPTTATARNVTLTVNFNGVMDKLGAAREIRSLLDRLDTLEVA